MRKITQSKLAPGVTVLIAAFDDIPEHLFLVEEVLEDCITGQALIGPLVGAYGEPELGMILKVLPRVQSQTKAERSAPTAPQGRA